jgi:iron complex transport system ATP-binding protein
MSLACINLTLMAGNRVLVRDLDLTIERGRFIGVLGRNGAGKTTALHVLAGLQEAVSGSVKLDDRSIGNWPRREVALRLGLLMQNYEDPFSSTVIETALIGRHPHLGFWQWETNDDVRIAHEAIRQMALHGLEQRQVDTLSGGERRRLALATVLAQDPDIYLLDEPANHLDPQHIHDVMTLFRAHADSGRAVMASLHDVNAAERYCDRCLLLFGDGRWLEGATNEVLNEDNLRDLYGIRIRQLEWEGRRIFVAS